MEITKRKSLTGERYLNFIIDSEQYCIDITMIREIMAMTELTPIPQTPDFISGVINLRGKIIPIIDLRLKFGLPFLEYTNRSCIVVVELVDDDEQATLMGLTVDTIHEVVNISESKIYQVPLINSKIESDYIKGMVEVEGQIMVVLDIESIIGEDEFVLLDKIGSI